MRLSSSEVSGGRMMRNEGQQHVPVHLAGPHAQRGGRHALPGRTRLDAGAHLFGHPRRGVEAQAQDRRDEDAPWRRDALDRVAKLHRQDFGHDEVPEEHLHQQRNVAEELDVRGAQDARPFRLRGAGHAHHDADAQRQDPGQRRGAERPRHAGQQRAQVDAAGRRHLKKNMPIPVVVHGCIQAAQAGRHGGRGERGARGWPRPALNDRWQGPPNRSDSR